MQLGKSTQRSLRYSTLKLACGQATMMGGVASGVGAAAISRYVAVATCMAVHKAEVYVQIYATCIESDITQM